MSVGNGVPRLVSMRRLEQLLGMPRAALRRIASSAPDSYRPFRRRKGTSDEFRVIDNPSKNLVEVQRKILRRILEQVPVPPTMNGGVRGRTLAANAGMHVGQAVVATLDIRRCFPRTRHDRVFALFRDTFGCSTEIANLLTRLTTFQGCLPQGAATSTLLANLLLLPMHDEIAEFCKARGLRMSFWVDDIVVSGALGKSDTPALVRIVANHGYTLSWKKIRVQPRSRRQEVPGCVVNAGLSRGRRREGRAGLADYRREILEVAARGPTPQALQRLRGRIASVRQVSARQGDALERLARGHVPGY